jgi:protocatechuate 3,4-dioxygenase beta subunit
MRNLTEDNLTQAVVERVAAAPDARVRELMTALVEHLHSFARKVNLTPGEWNAAIKFLVDTGKLCDDRRNEFILLSDTLGLSALVDIIANRDKTHAATESSLLGPFYRRNAPVMSLGASIARGVEGAPLEIRGSVRSEAGDPIANAKLDVWTASPAGLYDLQLPQAEGMNMRGVFRTDAAGRFHFRSVKPSSYPVPTDGPVGTMLNALGRHPFRPAHIHFMISADGYDRLTTALYIAGDEYLESDAVFGSRESLVVGYEHSGSIDSINFDFVLASRAS